MDNTTKTFVVARYNFTTLFKDQANQNFIKDLMTEPYLKHDEFEYALGNFEPDREDGFTLFRGTFGRIRKGDLGLIYDRTTKEFKQKQLPELADVMLEFIIHHDSHLIFIEHNSDFLPEKFANRFIEIYMHTSPAAELEIDFIFEEKDVYNEIKQWQRVETITFRKLRPSNPSSLDDFKEIEDLLKETNSAKTDIEFHSAPRKDKNPAKGLNYESKLIKQSLALSAHGYGEAEIKGIDQKEKSAKISKKYLKKITIDFSEDGALKQIIQEIEELNKNEKDE